MAGRGALADAQPLDTNNGKMLVMRNGRWQEMFRPLNPDREFSGTCLAESFAKAYSDEHPSVQVGIIPCADGGTSIEQWSKGGLLFDNAVNCARLAKRTSNLVGILWHQGETDCKEESYPYYLERLIVLMNDFRDELNQKDIPIIVGGMGDFLKDRTQTPFLKNYNHINTALKKFTQLVPNTAFVSASGLTSNPDNLHFNHNSLQEFGLRYYKAFKAVENQSLSSSEKDKLDDSKRNELEKL